MNQNNKPPIKLSVLVPSFNDVHYIKECMDSILVCKSEEIEIIVCDDCSNDHTLEIVKKYKDSRLKVFESSKRVGGNENWKKCLSKAKGKWVHFLASDDYYFGDSLEIILRNLTEDEGVYLLTHNCFEDDTNKIFDIQCNKDKTKKFFSHKSEVHTSKLLHFFNHDELVLAVFPSNKFSLIKKLSNFSCNSSFMYWVIAIFLNSKVFYIQDASVMKRYKHKIKRPKSGELGDNKSVLGMSFKGITGDLYNSFILGLSSKNFFIFSKLLFSNRYNDVLKGGFYGISKSKSYYFFLGPFFQLFLGPFLILFKRLKLHKKFK